MAKGYDKGRQPRGKAQGYYDSKETGLIQRLGEMVSDLYMSTDEKDVQRLWNSAHRALVQTKADKERVSAVIAQRRIGALAKLVSELAAPEQRLVRSGPSASQATVVGVERSSSAHAPVNEATNVHADPVVASSISSPEDSSSTTPVAALGSTAAPSSASNDTLKNALKAFRKRLKLTKLNDESKLGRSPMSSGKKSQVQAIMPPREYPKSVWDELTRQGKIKDTGGGFYELAGE